VGAALASKDFNLVNSLQPSKTTWTNVRMHAITVVRHLHEVAGHVTNDADPIDLYDGFEDHDDNGVPIYTIDDIMTLIWIRAFDGEDAALMKVAQDYVLDSALLHKTGLEDHFIGTIYNLMQAGESTQAYDHIQKASWFANLDFLTQDVLDHFSSVVVEAIIDPDMIALDDSEFLTYMIVHHPKFDNALLQEDFKTALLASTMDEDDIDDAQDRLNVMFAA
jgi:hypothetical protein